MKKRSTHIRVGSEDKDKWNSYCKNLGVKSPKLFNKVITSKQIELDKRVLEEIKKKETDFLRRVRR